MRYIALVLKLIIANNAFAVDGVMLSYGSGMNDMLIQSEDISDAEHAAIGLFWESEIEWEHDLFGYGQLEYEFYFTQISHYQTSNGVVFRPLLNFRPTKDGQSQWYWQFGVGLSYFDSKSFDPIEFSTNGQFATLFGIGTYLDKDLNHRLTLRYNHYSNAYLVKPNPGLDTISLDWHIRL